MRKYTQQENEWLQENYQKYSNQELAQQFCTRFSTTVYWDTLRTHCNKILGLKKERIIKNIYTKEMQQWLLDNYYNYKSNKSLAKDFNKHFDTKKDVQAITNYCNRVLKIKKVEKYTPEQIQWLKDNYGNYVRVIHLVDAFKKQFNCNKNDTCLQSYISRHIKKKEYDYSSEEKQWLRENFTKYLTYAELTKAFNERFDTRSQTAIRSFCRVALGLKKLGKEYEQGKIVKRNGRLFIKVTNMQGDNNFQKYNHYVWEKANGKIPKGYRLVFLDGNPLNCDITNLDIVEHKTQVGIRHFTIKGEPQFNKKVVECMKIKSQIERVIGDAE